MDKTIKRRLAYKHPFVIRGSLLKGKTDKGMLFREPDKTRREEKGGRQLFRFISFCTFHYFRYVWTFGMARGWIGRSRLHEQSIDVSRRTCYAATLQLLRELRESTTSLIILRGGVAQRSLFAPELQSANLIREGVWYGESIKLPTGLAWMQSYILGAENSCRSIT